MVSQKNPRSSLNDAILREINAAIGSLEYGSVTIKVHASKIIQIEVAEKRRFDDAWKVEQGGGI